ncbi:protein lingerer-like [Spodoptera litura]|uniref:Protein lingerer-like n=1 Tax=Spodoptera litura TaxID=69820 RepID=A0A9J7E7S1_SPOLT|nr:protein lingerer-like [Spodoptera litura]
MFFLMKVFLLWIGFIHEQDCAIINMDTGKHFKGFDFVVQKYLDPLRKLQEELPNHAIEMQIELHDALPTYTKTKPQRRLIRVLNPRKPKPVKRTQGGNEDAAASLSAPSNTSTPAPPAAPGGAGKVPVYMDDLKKALEDLEKKLSGMTTTTTTAGAGAGTTSNGGTSCNGGGGGGNGGGGGSGGGIVKNVLQTPIRSIDNILEILKRAIHIEHREPKPSENLEWVQVKIPK